MAQPTRRPSADRTKVTRHEFEAVRAMVTALQAEVAALRHESEIQIRRAGELQRELDTLKKLIGHV